MGRLRIDRTDFPILEKLTGDRVVVQDDVIQVRMGQATVSVTQSQLQGHCDVKGVRVAFDLKLVDGHLEVDLS